MSYDSHCNACPYLQQRHLPPEYLTNRLHPPIELENNKSTILLVFQSPGEEEWKVGKSIQPTIKQGGTAGARIKYSWERKQKISGVPVNRLSFDIINSVQCFPGKIGGNRDLEPNVIAICCSKRLSYVLNLKQYTKVIAFGDFAFQVISNLVSSLSQKPLVVNAQHPNGGVTNATLDALW